MSSLPKRPGGGGGGVRSSTDERPHIITYVVPMRQLLRAPYGTCFVLGYVWGSDPVSAPLWTDSVIAYSEGRTLTRLGGFAIVWNGGGSSLAFLAWRTGTSESAVKAPTRRRQAPARLPPVLNMPNAFLPRRAEPRRLGRLAVDIPSPTFARVL